MLSAAARAKSDAKTKAAEQGIRALIKRGEPITFQAVQREAGVSHAFLYGTPTSAAGSNADATKHALAPRRPLMPTSRPRWCSRSPRSSST